MPTRNRANFTKRQALDADSQAWLRGDKEKSGMMQFKPDEELAALFEEHGDTDSMWWCRDLARPITLETLEAFEDGWLSSGESDECGMRSYFIAKHYSDDEKQTLWAERGDKSLYRYLQGARKPEAI